MAKHATEVSERHSSPADPQNVVQWIPEGRRADILFWWTEKTPTPCPCRQGISTTDPPHSHTPRTSSNPVGKIQSNHNFDFDHTDSPATRQRVRSRPRRRFWADVARKRETSQHDDTKRRPKQPQRAGPSVPDGESSEPEPAFAHPDRQDGKG